MQRMARLWRRVIGGRCRRGNAGEAVTVVGDERAYFARSVPVTNTCSYWVTEFPVVGSGVGARTNAAPVIAGTARERSGTTVRDT